MSNAFTNWLSSNSSTILRDYQHASRLYLDNNYAKIPKLGFLFFVNFNINLDAIQDAEFANKQVADVGFLVKKVDLPKFKISTETLNQYNRKTVVQTKLTYENVSIEFHDDSSDIINNLWIQYFRHSYRDSNYGGSALGRPKRNELPYEFKDTKFLADDIKYGRYHYKKSLDPFFTTVDLYVLHMQQFTQITLVNPKVTEWAHDTLNQNENNKILQNRMGLAYETVLYNQGTIEPGSNPENFTAIYYDNTKSPYSAGYGNTSGKDDVYGTTSGNFKSPIPASGFGSALKPTPGDFKGFPGSNSGYSVANSLFNSSFSDIESQAGKFNVPGGVGINTFAGFNSSNNGLTEAAPVSLLSKLGGGI
jgi:hypothetical protein